MANHKSSKKRIRQTLTKRAHNRPIPQDDAQRREGPALDHREECRRGPAAEGNGNARQAGQAQHHAQEQGCKPEERHPAPRERPLNLERPEKGPKSPGFFFVIRTAHRIPAAPSWPWPEPPGARTPSPFRPFATPRRTSTTPAPLGLSGRNDHPRKPARPQANRSATAREGRCLFQGRRSRKRSGRRLRPSSRPRRPKRTCSVRRSSRRRRPSAVVDVRAGRESPPPKRRRHAPESLPRNRMRRTNSLLRDVDVNHDVDLQPMPGKDLVELLGLVRRAGKAVEDAPLWHRDGR